MHVSSRRPFLALLGMVLLPSSGGKACSPAAYRPAQQAALASAPGNASAAATAFMAVCKGPWNAFDVRKYFYSNWHAGAPAGSSCDSLVRLGSYDDGGKMVCRPQRALAHPCNVLSIGSDGDPSFEDAVHAYAPHCRIETHDGSLTGKRAKLREQLPSYIHFVPENMHAETWRRWSNTTAGRDGHNTKYFINVAKVDCEGCEADTVPNMVENVCINYLLLETHSCGGAPSNSSVKPRRRKTKGAMAMHSSAGADSSAYGMVRRAHDMLVRLDRLYTIYHVEPNTVYSDGTCIEFAFERRELCGMDGKASV